LYYNILATLKPEEIIEYFRKSRTDDPTLSVEEVLAKHENMLNEWAERNLGACIPEENKYREVVSGETIADRPEIQKVLKLIESPKIKAILIVDVQRLSRGDLEDAGRLIKLIRYTNTLVITPMKTFNLSDEYDRDMFERELKRGNEFLEYQKKIMGRGRLLSVSQGNYIGTNPPYGYDKTYVLEGKRKCPTLAINEEQANVVRMVFDMYVNQDMSYHAIAARLDELNISPLIRKHWSASAILHMITNPHYIGKVRWNFRKTVVVVEDGEVKKTNPIAKEGDYYLYEGKHPAIISEELYEKAQQRKGTIPRVKARNKISNPLAGIFYCQCGKAMVRRPLPRRQPPHDYRFLCSEQIHCHTSSCVSDEVIDFLIDLLKQKITEFEVEVKNENNESAELHEKLIANLEKKLADNQAREIQQWESQFDPDPSKRVPHHIFQMLNEKLLKEREEIEKALQEAHKSIPTKMDYQQKIVTLQNAISALQDPSASVAEKNKLLKMCIKRITYSRAQAERIGGVWHTNPIELDIQLML
jgi:hypothetical protein